MRMLNLELTTATLPQAGDPLDTVWAPLAVGSEHFYTYQPAVDGALMACEIPGSQQSANDTATAVVGRLEELGIEIRRPADTTAGGVRSFIAEAKECMDYRLHWCYGDEYGPVVFHVPHYDRAYTSKWDDAPAKVVRRLVDSAVRTQVFCVFDYTADAENNYLSIPSFYRRSTPNPAGRTFSLVLSPAHVRGEPSRSYARSAGDRKGEVVDVLTPGQIRAGGL